MDRRARGGLVLLFFLILVSSCFEALGIGMMFPFIKLIQNPSDAASVPLIGPMFASVAPESGRVVMLGCAILFVLFVVKNAITFFAFYARTKFVHKNQVKLAAQLLHTYMRSPYTLHLERNSAEVIRNVNGSAGTVFAIAVSAFIEILTEVMTAAALFVTLAVTDLTVTLAAGAVIGVSAGIFLYILPPVMHGYGRRGNAYKRELIKTLQHCLGGMKEIKVLGREAYFESAYRRVAEDTAHVRIVTPVLQMAPRHVIEVTIVASMLVGILTLTRLGDSTSHLLAVLGVFALAAYRLLPSANRILSSINNINFSRPPIEDVHRDITSFKEAVAEASNDQPTTGLAFTNRITLENISYAYPGAEERALVDINQSIRRGESIGVVGRSGAGKTTLIDIVLGVLTPTTGRILVDGENTMTHMRSWQQNIGYVPQTIYLTDDTLRRNVAFGVEDDAIDNTRVDAVLEAAYLTHFVKSLPDGLDTVVGEVGVRLSGGQRQRIGIARALYHDPEVLVMDEATSSVDNETERHISAAIQALRGRKTILIIAHRLSTIHGCDRLIFLDHGHCMATGSFDELMAGNASFRAMVQDGEWAEGATPDPKVSETAPLAEPVE